MPNNANASIDTTRVAMAVADISIVLRQAATLLRERGLAQQVGQDEQGRLCIVTAIATAASSTRNVPIGMAYIASIAAMAVHLGMGTVTDVIHWNDKPGQTVDRAAEALEACARELVRDILTTERLRGYRPDQAA